MPNLRCLGSAILLLLVGVPATTWAQIRSSTISGVVTDQAGALVPDARLVVVEQNTNQRYETTSNAAGEFLVPYLPPGTYSVIVGKEGFAENSRRNVPLGASETVRLQVSLRLGTVEASVSVSAAAIQLQTESAQVSGATTSTAIAAVPNMNHNPMFYATLQVGVVARSAANDTKGAGNSGVGYSSRRNFSAISIGGGMSGTNDVQVDGISVQGSAWNEVTVLPNSDGIEEVRTSVNNFSAEYGRGQGVISMITKSGTNQYHGSLMYRHRNNAVNANTFANNARGIPEPDFVVHTFGGTVGGPIRKDKAFLFASYEALRFNDAVNMLRTVPTPREKTGDFSQTMANVGGRPTPLQLFDPFSVVQESSNVYRRAVIPNAVIANPDPRILKLLAYFPDPNRPPEDQFNSNNYLINGDRTIRRHNVNSRVDYRAGQHSLYLTSGITHGAIRNPRSWGPDNPFNSPDGAPNIDDNNPYAMLGDTFVVSPSLVVDFRYGAHRIKMNSYTPPVDGFDYDAFGIPREIQALNILPGVPTNFTADGNAYWSRLDANSDKHKRERQTNHHLAGSATKTVGKWTLKSGAEFRNMLSNYTDPRESISWRINSSYTAGPLVNATGGLASSVTADRNGHSYASLLLGAGMFEIRRGRNVQPALSQKYVAFYSQNDWRPTPRLTINIGLRYDIQPGPTERYDRITAFDNSRVNPFGTPGAYHFAGQDGATRNLWLTHWRDFGPRGGLAYRFGGDVVLRLGYGLTYLPTNTGYFDGPSQYGTTAFAGSTDALPFGTSPAGVLVGKYDQVTRAVPATGADATEPSIYGDTMARFDMRDYRNGKSQQWNVFLEKRWGGWLLSAGYMGMRANDLTRGRIRFNSDQFFPDSVLNSWREDYIRRNGTGHAGTDQVRNPYQPDSGELIPFLGVLAGATMQRRQTMYQWPFFQAMQINSTGGWSSYNAMILRVNRSMAKGLLLDAHYTWSKALDCASVLVYTNGGFNDGFADPSLDFRNLRNSYRLTGTDIPHRLVATYVYNLPLGDHWLARGWQTAGTFIAQAGQPISVNGASTGAINGMPDVLAGGPTEVPKDLQRWYDGKTTVMLPSGRRITPCANCFLKYSSDQFVGRTVTVANGSRRADQYWWGTAAQSYSSLRTDGMATWNVSLQRSFRLAEGRYLEFSAQASNVLNRTQFRPAGFTGGLGNTELVADAAKGRIPNYGQSSNFGTHGMSTFDPRQFEFVLRYRF